MDIKEQIQAQIETIKATGERKKDGSLTKAALNQIEKLELQLEQLKAWSGEKPTTLNLF